MFFKGAKRMRFCKFYFFNRHRFLQQTVLHTEMVQKVLTLMRTVQNIHACSMLHIFTWRMLHIRGGLYLCTKMLYFETADFLSLPVELSDATYKGLVRPKMVLFSPQLFFTNILGLFWPLFLLFHISLQLSCSSTFLFRKTNCNFNFKFVSSPVGFTLILKTYLQIAYREYFPDCEC